MRLLQFPDSFREKRKHSAPEQIPRTRLEFGELFAEIIEDRRAQPRLYQTVIQKVGSPEILSLSQEISLEEAKRSAEQQMRLFATRLRERA
jgi:hypothetical protein